MLDAEVQVLEIAIQPPQCPQFSLANPQGTVDKDEHLVSKFESAAVIW